jgi:hypothetical protein
MTRRWWGRRTSSASESSERLPPIQTARISSRGQDQQAASPVLAGNPLDVCLVDIQTHRVHQRHGVAPCDRPWLHAVVESDVVLLEPVREVHICRAQRQCIGDRRERQVVGCDQADGSAIQQALQDSRSALESIVRIGAVKELVEKEQQRHGTGRDVCKLPDPRDLRAEASARPAANPGSEECRLAPTARAEASRPARAAGKSRHGVEPTAQRREPGCSGTTVAPGVSPGRRRRRDPTSDGRVRRQESGRPDWDPSPTAWRPIGSRSQ